MKNPWIAGFGLTLCLIAIIIEYIYLRSDVVPITKVSKIVSVSFEAIAPSSIRSERLELEQASLHAIIHEIPNGRNYPVSDGPGFENCDWIDLWFLNDNGSWYRVRCGFEIGSCTVSIPVFCDRWEAIIGNIRHIHAKVSSIDCNIITTNIVLVMNKSNRR